MKEFDALSLDGRLLRTFMAVLEQQSVTRAAEELGVSQSAVSHSLERLREVIGDPLFVKDGRGIAPTTAALDLAPKVTAILVQLEALVVENTYDPKNDTAALTIATQVTEMLPPLVAIRKAVYAVNPDIKLRFLALGPRTKTLGTLAAGLADFVIAAPLGNCPIELTIQRFYRDQIVCFYDPSMRTAPDDIEKYCAARHAVLDFGGNTKSVVDSALEISGHARNKMLATSNSYAMANLIQGTDLVATMPKRLSTTAFKDFAFCPAPFSLPLISYDLIWHERERNAPRHIWFRNLLQQSAHDFAQGDPDQVRMSWA
ncbi:MAG: LysR family transcriptional regulator [Arenibacterium sp.]